MDLDSKKKHFANLIWFIYIFEGPGQAALKFVQNVLMAEVCMVSAVWSAFRTTFWWLLLFDASFWICGFPKMGLPPMDFPYFLSVGSINGDFKHGTPQYMA
jgi:hypothetical protein